VRLTIDTAIPCGLILNELISNSLKYAFPAGRPGKIRISLHAKTDGQYVLVVGDDGIGLPDALEVKTAKSLGLQLVDNLTQQLHGSLALDRHPGTTFTVVFSESKSKG
jgi:two-component sensor histidine kinase